jgi:cardiolipin synthase
MAMNHKPLTFVKKIFFHRVIFVAFALATQLLILIGIILLFNEFFVFFYGLSLVISTISVFWILNDRSNPAYKIAWIIPILVFPIFGGLFHIFFGKKKLSKYNRQRLTRIAEKVSIALEKNPQMLEKLACSNRTAANQSQYIQDYSWSPPYVNTITEYLPSGEIKFERLKEELRNAKHYIFLEYYIIERGLMWDSVLNILVEKVKSGVEVRVIYDGVGCMRTLPSRYDRQLEDLGIQCCIFNPLKPILTARLNNRDHRKIAVIDGHVGFTGGINLADEYINAYEKFGHWKDTAIMLKGDAVWSLTVMFLAMWDYVRESNHEYLTYKYKQPSDLKTTSDEYVQPYEDSPIDNEPVGEIVYLNLINKATKYVYITTPYLIIDNEMATALISAAKGGVDVRIITPHVPDRWYVHAVTRSYYKPLVEGGVKVYEYTPGFIHSKTFVVDDDYGVVGTINMDYRSLFLHFECGVWLYRCNSIIAMREDFLLTQNAGQEITLEDLKMVKFYQKIAGSVLRIFAPLL